MSKEIQYNAAKAAFDALAEMGFTEAQLRLSNPTTGRFEHMTLATLQEAALDSAMEGAIGVHLVPNPERFKQVETQEGDTPPEAD